MNSLTKDSFQYALIEVIGLLIMKVKLPENEYIAYIMGIIYLGSRSGTNLELF